MTLFRLVGWLVPSGTAKTFKVMYELAELRLLVNFLQYSNSTHALLGLVKRNSLHNSIHAFPMFNVEICQFENVYSPDRKTPHEILDFVSASNPENCELKKK